MDSKESVPDSPSNSGAGGPSPSGGGGGPGGILDWKGPHSVVIPRTEAGFGFTLRHFVVYPPQSVLDDSKSENDFDVKGSHLRPQSSTEVADLRLEPQETIFVKSVRAGSPAHSAGLTTGDRIVAVNGDSVTGKPYSQVISLIHDSSKTLKLLVVPKDEDILQMAYQCEGVGDTVFASNPSLSDCGLDGLTNSPPPPPPRNNSHDRHPASRLGAQLRSASCDQELLQHPPSNHPNSSPGPRKIPSLQQIQKQKATSLSQDFTSSLPSSSQPSSSLSSSSKMSIASNIPSKTKYSFGLYFPPKSTAQGNTGRTGGTGTSGASVTSSRTISTESLGLRGAAEGSTGTTSMTSSRPSDSGGRRSSDTKYRKSSLDETQTAYKSGGPSSSQSTASTRSRDYFTRYSADKSNSDAARNSARYSLRHSTHEPSSGSSSSDNNKPVYIITRSQTVSSISPSSTSSPSSSSTSYSRRSGDFSKTSRRRGVGGGDGVGELECKSEVTRQVRNVSSLSDSKPSRTTAKTDVHVVSSYSREAGGVKGGLSSSSSPSNQHQPPTAKVTTTTSSANSGSSGSGATKTFVVRIPCEQQQPSVVTISQGRDSPSSFSSSTNQQATTPSSSRQSYGTAFALKRSPTTTHIEIQKAISKPIVSQRKTQFELKREEPYQPSAAAGRVASQNNRYKMEIDRIRTQPKFSSFASRKASFEQSPDRDWEEDGKEMTPTGVTGSASQSPKPVVKIRRISTDSSNSSGTPPPSVVSGYRERSSTVPSGASTPAPLTNVDSGSPICIYVTPGATNNNNSNNRRTQPEHSASMVVSVIAGGDNKPQSMKISNNNLATGETTIVTRNNLSTSPTYQDEPLSLTTSATIIPPQRHHRSSPSPSSLSTGTMGDSGVWVKSYHSSNDMLDSGSSLSSSPNPCSTTTTMIVGGGGEVVVSAPLPPGSTTTTTSSTSGGLFGSNPPPPPSSSSQDYTDSRHPHHQQVFPRQRHKSYMEAMNSPRDSAAISQQAAHQQAHRGVHTQSPQQMLAQSQTVPHPMPSSSSSSSSAYPPPPPPPSSSLSSSSKEMAVIVEMSGGVGGGNGLPTRPVSYSPLPPSKIVGNQHHHHHHHQQQPTPYLHQQQQQHHPHHHHHHHQHSGGGVFPGSSSSLSLGSILGEDTSQPIGSSVMSASDSAVSLCGPPGGSSSDISKSNTSLSVTMRKKAQESLEDQASKLHRRTSYLMATAKDRTNAVPIEQAFSPPPTQQQEPPSNLTRQPSAVKLNKFFGEQIPSIAESQESKSVEDEECTPPPTPPPEVIRKGPLSCKIAVMEGKKCSDRSWKTVYVILRQTEMFVTKDPSASHHFENQMIPLKSCMVEFARDYAKKKKNVFRLTTHQECEYLFQAEDRGTMLCWIQAIKSINEPDKAEKMDEMIAHEAAKHGPAPVEVNVVSAPTPPSNKLSPPLGHMAKKLSGLSLRSKLTASPNMRRKKSNASEKDKEKPEKEESVKKSWKGRIPMMKNLKKHSEDSLAPPSLDLDPGGGDTCKQFGMPIQDCFPSPYNEYVPLIVELCTRIVETRGLEVVGVYRVPGNSVAVHALVDEFNRGIDYVNIDNEKLLDINVISSLLKSFFRKLPEPLVNAESYDGFIEANRNPDGVKRMLKLKRLLYLLPPHHNETFKHMAEHLNKVASYGNINKMDAKNLAIMFGPTLIRKSEDDTVSLVTDMSDQCRIIESIILHHEWFFSQWDQDSHIPMETKVETVLLGEGQGLKDDDEEADSAISTKEIISSIVGAASRKLRDQQQKSEDSLDSACGVMYSSHLSSQDGRSFYHETQSVTEASSSSLLASSSARTTPLPSSKSHNSLASSHGSSQRLSAQDFISATNNNVTNSEPDFLDLEFADASAGTPTNSTPTTFTRHLSDESLLEKNDELEISHGLGTSMSRQTIHNTLMRIGNDVKTLLQTFEQKQLVEMERRRKEQEAIEHEHLRTQLELEQEDSHSVDDWLAMRGSGVGGISSHSQMPDLVSSSYVGGGGGELYAYTQQPQSLNPYGGGVHVGLDGDRLEQRMMEMDRRGGFVKPGATAGFPSHPPHLVPRGFHSHQGSLDSANSNSRTSFDTSYDDLLSSVSHQLHRGGEATHSPHSPQHFLSQQMGGGVVGGPPLPHRGANLPTSTHPRQKNVHLAVEKQHLRPSSFRLSMGGRRHGSLDSLIDLIDKRSSWASTDSEDGSDLLTSLTTTFDQKLQILVNPKYKLTGSHGVGRKHYGSDVVKPATIVSDMKETALWRSSGDTLLRGAAGNKPSVLIGGPATLNPYPSSVLDSDRPFRDPSLHRSSKPEAKIGIASRFERTDNRALSSSPVMNVSDSANPQQQQRSPRKAPLPDFGAFLNRHNINGQQLRDVPSISLTQPKKLDDNAIYVLRSLNKRNDSSSPSSSSSSRSISKSEKTEMNSNLARLSREEKGLASLAAGASEEDGDCQENKENKRRRRSERKQGHRRHTVGGTQDFEHIDALVQVCCSRGGDGEGFESTDSVSKVSAWDQLQPVTKDGHPQDRNLQSWLMKERTRGSTPDLSIGE